MPRVVLAPLLPPFDVNNNNNNKKSHHSSVHAAPLPGVPPVSTEVGAVASWREKQVWAMTVSCLQQCPCCHLFHCLWDLVCNDRQNRQTQPCSSLPVFFVSRFPPPRRLLHPMLRS